MPPVAQPQIEPWRQRLDELLERNEGTDRPSSVRALAAALAAQPGSTQNESSWLTTLKRIRREGRATERNAIPIAKALGVPRRDLPPAADRLNSAVLDLRLAVVEEEGVTFEDLKPVMHVLQLLATGKRSEALRALTEAAEALR